MLLKTRFMLSMIFVFFVFGIAEAVILRLVVFDSFTQLEQNEAIRDIERVDHSINREVHHLGLLCHDWASWDEMYDFVNDGNKKFVDSNLLLNSFKANNCNLIYIWPSNSWCRIIISCIFNKFNIICIFYKSYTFYTFRIII